jgi:hypothetical protein
VHTIPGITVREEARNFPENSEEGLFVIFCQAIFSTIGCPHVDIPLEMNPFFWKEAAKFSERNPRARARTLPRLGGGWTRCCASDAAQLNAANDRYKRK